jgi:PTH2 family peptidyl-tRNA hydrolase
MNMPDEFKQVIVVNVALNLPAGKLSAQVAHAAVAAFLKASKESQNHWVQDGMPKVVLKVGSEEELRDLLRSATAKELPAALITDAGKTVIPEGTVTCLGIGPAAENEIDTLTGVLELLH